MKCLAKIKGIWDIKNSSTDFNNLIDENINSNLPPEEAVHRKDFQSVLFKELKESKQFDDNGSKENMNRSVMKVSNLRSLAKSLFQFKSPQDRLENNFDIEIGAHGLTQPPNDEFGLNPQGL